MNNLKKIFKKDKNIIIGAIHFPPLLGYADFPGFKIAMDNALKDLMAFEKGGVDAVIIENNYDIPHKAFVDSSVVASLTYLGAKIKQATKLPIGISVLWNDYRVALSIAKTLGLKFIRVPVFVDKVKTSYGIMTPQAKKVIEYRKLINAEDVLLFTDIHVKHAKILSKDTIIVSAKKAIRAGSDALVITGKWTGDAPNLKEIKNVKNTIGDFPLIIGSGLNCNNIKSLFNYANGAIVSTSLKKGISKKAEINVKAYEQRIDENEVKIFKKALN